MKSNESSPVLHTNSTQCMEKNAGQLLGSTDTDAAALKTLSLPFEECHIKCMP